MYFPHVVSRHPSFLKHTDLHTKLCFPPTPLSFITCGAIRGEILQVLFQNFNTEAFLSKLLYIYHQHQFKVIQKKYLPLASKIAEPDVKRGFGAMRSEAIGLDDFQIYLDPQLKV